MRNSCPACAEKISALKRMSISLFNNAECPKCGSRITFAWPVLFTLLLAQIAVVVAFALIFFKGESLFGTILLVLLLGAAFLIYRTAKLKLE